MADYILGDPIKIFASSSVNHIDGVTGITDWVVRINKAGTNTFANGTGTMQELAYGWYSYTPAQNEIGIGENLFHLTATGIDPIDFKISFELTKATEASGILKKMMKYHFFQYVGDSENVFSIISGQFVGEIHFYGFAFDDFLSDTMVCDATNLICTLPASNIMEDGANIAEDYDIIGFRLEGFETLENIVINYYSKTNNMNTRFFLTAGLTDTTNTLMYFPTADGNLLRYSGSPELNNITNSELVRIAFNMGRFDWSRISAPLVVTTTNLSNMGAVVRLNLARDRDFEQTFELSRDITGGSVWFAIKNDRSHNFYSIEPKECTVTDYVKGSVEVYISVDEMANLQNGTYYGELLLKTSDSKYINMISYEIKINDVIIDSKDV